MDSKIRIGDRTFGSTSNFKLPGGGNIKLKDIISINYSRAAGAAITQDSANPLFQGNLPFNFFITKITASVFVESGGAGGVNKAVPYFAVYLSEGLKPDNSITTSTINANSALDNEVQLGTNFQELNYEFVNENWYIGAKQDFTIRFLAVFGAALVAADVINVNVNLFFKQA